jgi:hypothetical protein
MDLHLFPRRNQMIIRGTILLLLLLMPLSAPGATYTWEDDQGSTNFTEDPGNIPKKYRKKARIIGGDEPAPATIKEEPTKQLPSAKPQEPAEGEEVVETPPPRPKQSYAGKGEDAWKAEFRQIRQEIREQDKELARQHALLVNPEGIGRAEYAKLQASIKALEAKRLESQKKLDTLKAEATKAGAPPDVQYEPE